MPLALWNACEAGLWLCLAATVAISKRNAAPTTRRLAFATGGMLVLFALSDLLEIRSGAWWRPPELLVLKCLCVIGLAVGFTRLLRAPD